VTTAADPVVIVSAARTPMGAFMGELSTLTAPQLGATAISAALTRAQLDPSLVDEVLLGNVLAAGLGQAPSRQAALGAGLRSSVPCTGVSKVCGSGMKALMLAHDAIVAGSTRIAVAGGMESMTNAPYLLSKARSGHRIGHGRVIDHMMFDGLEDAYDVAADGGRRSMGTFGEDCAKHYGFTRAAQDEFAAQSVRWAQRAAAEGAFDWELAPIEVAAGRSGKNTIASDEGPRRIDATKITTLRPAFAPDGSITAASSSSINDGAAALVLMRQSHAQSLGLKPLARIVAHAAHAREPAWFTTAPVGAIEALMRQTGWSVTDVDLWEINEAFAVVPMAAMADLSIARERINVNGGACALGHPIGASGARIVVTLLGALRKRGLRRGVASLCIGGGEATALAIERD
jgi:acetyl-CoA C-acetyltransferase